MTVINGKVAKRNIDDATVEGFGEEWDEFDQTAMSDSDKSFGASNYFDIFPWQSLPEAAEGFDLGCGSGRWAVEVAPRVGTLHCIDPAAKALAVARRRLGDRAHVRFHEASSVDSILLPDSSQDLGFSLGLQLCN